MRNVICFLLIAVFMSSKSASAQNSQILTVKDSLKVQKKASALTSKFLDSHSLASLRDSKKLKSIVNETICYPPGKYYSAISSSTGRALIGPMFGVPSANEGTLDLAPDRTDNSTNYDEITMVVKKASSSKIIVVYHDEEYKIETRDSGLKYMMLLKDRDELLRQINQLYKEEEQEVLHERQNNLAVYRETVAKFRKGDTGPIKVNTGGRKYDGSIPFSQSRDGRNLNSADTYLDETFVFNKKTLEKKIEWLKEKRDEANDDLESQREYDDALREIEIMRNDTLGLFLNKERNTYDDSRDEVLFINLRTGQVLRNRYFYSFNHYLYGLSFSEDLLESTTYLNNYAKAAPFVYDGTWSLRNLLYGYCPNTKYPQAVYEALEGEKVYVLKKDNYEEDEIVEMHHPYYNDHNDRNYEPRVETKIETKKNGVVGIDRIVGVRWLEKLQEMVGKKVVMRTDDGMFYKEDLPSMKVWTIDGIEAKKYNRENRLELDMHLSHGNEKSTIDVLEDCSLLTRSVDLSRPINGNGRTVLSYDYLVKNAPAMPAEVKRQREAEDRFFNAFSNAIEREIKNYDPVKQMKKQAKETHVYECQRCHARLKATGKGNFFQSGKCSSGFPHAWEKID